MALLFLKMQERWITEVSRTKSHQSCRHLLSLHTLRRGWKWVASLPSDRHDTQSAGLMTYLKSLSPMWWRGKGLRSRTELPLSKKTTIGRGRHHHSSPISHASHAISGRPWTSALFLGLVTMSLSLDTGASYHLNSHIWIHLARWMPRHSQNSVLALRQTGCL